MLERFAEYGELDGSLHVVTAGDLRLGYQSEGSKTGTFLIERTSDHSTLKCLSRSLLFKARHLAAWGAAIEFDYESGHLEFPVSVNSGTVRQIQARWKGRHGKVLSGDRVGGRLQELKPDRIDELPGMANSAASFDDAWERASDLEDARAAFFGYKRPRAFDPKAWEQTAMLHVWMEDGMSRDG